MQDMTVSYMDYINSACVSSQGKSGLTYLYFGDERMGLLFLKKPKNPQNPNRKLNQTKKTHKTQAKLEKLCAQTRLVF